MSELYEGAGIFGHKPTPEEANAKAFVMPRAAQPSGFWPGYCCALSDMGVPFEEVNSILIAALNGQFAHNVEPAFMDEVADEYEEDDVLDETE